MTTCPNCGAAWDLELDPVACTCDFDDPDLPYPQAWTVEVATDA